MSAARSSLTCLFVTACLVACGGSSGGGGGGAGTADGAPGGDGGGGGGADGAGVTDGGGSSCAGHTIFVTRAGGTYTAGADDPAANVSSVVTGTRTVPPFDDAATFGTAMTCVRALFAAYDVAIVETAPASGDYVELVVGGNPEHVGAPSGSLGISPTQCTPLARAVGFVFPEPLGAIDAQTLCELVGHQAGAIYGLEVELLPRDIMSYILADMPKRFLDEAASCGATDPEACQCGAATQNSHAKLLAALGPRRACL